MFNKSLHRYQFFSRILNRILNLPLMIAAILTLLWRNVPSVNELTRILNREGFLWVNVTKVSQKALSPILKIVII
jgi:hypothetical protein